MKRKDEKPAKTLMEWMGDRIENEFGKVVRKQYRVVEWTPFLDGHWTEPDEPEKIVAYGKVWFDTLEEAEREAENFVPEHPRGRIRIQEKTVRAKTIPEHIKETESFHLIRE